MQYEYYSTREKESLCEYIDRLKSAEMSSDSIRILSTRPKNLSSLTVLKHDCLIIRKSYNYILKMYTLVGKYCTY